MTVHNCFRFRGSGPGCEGCEVNKRGFCEQMITQLERINKSKKFNSYFRPSLFDEMDRENILSSVVSAVIGSLDTFEGRNNARFGTWVWGIKNNVLNAFLRDAYKHTRNWIPLDDLEKGTAVGDKSDTNINGGETPKPKSKAENIEDDCPEADSKDKETRPIIKSILLNVYDSQKDDFEKNQLVNNVLHILRSRFLATDPLCANLITSWYEWLNDGLSQKEMADKLGRTENTFNQSLRRCFQNFKNYIEL